MALTKISTGGVKDDAASQAKIADEAVDEARLQVSNAGTNGQFLSKQSGNTGGLTWATVDTNLSSDTTPQLGGDVDTNDHNIEFKDRNGTDDANVLNFGAGDDMRLYSDGTNGYLQADTELRIGTASNTTNAVFTNTKFDFRQDVDITNSKKLGIGGSYGSSGQVFTSGGSGAAPSWTTINASPSITANADGALAAGDPVYMKTDGTVKKIVKTIVNDSAPSNAISDTQISSGQVDRNTLAISPEGIGLCFYTDAHSDFSSNKIMIRPFKIGSDDTITRGTATQIGGGTIDDFRIIWSITNNGNPVFIVQYRGTSTNSNDPSNTNTTTRYCPFMVNASSLAITRGNGQTQGENCKEPDIVRSGTSGEFLAVQPIQDVCYWRIYKYDNSSSTVGNISLEDYEHQPRSQGGYSGSGDGCDVRFRHNSLLHDPDRDELLLFMHDERNGSCTMQYEKGATVWIDAWNQTSISQSDITRPQPWNTNHVGMSNRLKANYIHSCYDTTNDRVVVVFTDEDQSNKTYIMAGTNNGKSSASISWGTPVELDANECPSVQCVFDPSQEKVLVSYGDPSDSNKFKWVLCTVNSSNNSVSIGTVFTDTHIWDTSDYNTTERGGPVYDATNKRYVRFYRKDADSNNGYLVVAKTTSASTTAGGFIGFSDAAVSSGNAANIDIVGSVNENQSSLTVGSKYYLQSDGTLGTSADTPSVEAGTAVAATKIIVKG